MEDRIKILLTGGHAATTGMAVVQALKRKNSNAQICWIGSKQALSGSKTTTLEHKIYPGLGVKYFEIKAGKLQTKFTRYTIPLALMIPYGFVQALLLLIKIRPRVLLSFGGAASFALTFWAWIFKIPVIIHEQTTSAGRSTLASARFATKIALAHPESAKYFPRSKTVITGNPLTHEILSVKSKMSIGKDKTILVMGGSRGSEFINEEIIKIVPGLLKKYKLIHITGERDYYKYKNFASENYRVIDFVKPELMPEYYKSADIVISRSGANTISEILYLKRPAILIPLPRTYMDEQVKNAKKLESLGLATVLTENQVTPEKLTSEIEEKFKNWNLIVGNLESQVNPDLNAAEKVADLVLGFAR